ncbi:MAG TPA: ABC transporter permease [Armatimonadetes bacterium]|nr:ABC transporter permease [Armatimonadota bacterium]
MGEGTAGGPAARFLGGWRRWVLSREGLLLLLLLATVSLMAHLSPRFLRLDNLFAMTRHFVEIGLLALPMTLVLITAGIDLSVGSMLGLSAVALGLTWRGTRSLATGVLAALGAGLLAGTANGLLVARLHIPALIVTLATLAIYRGLALGLSQAEAVHDFPESFYWLGQGYVGPFPAQLLLFGGLAMAATIFLSCTTVGRSLYALGGNEETARLSGLPVAQLKLLVYALSGLLAGLAGVTYVSRVATAKPDAGLGLELDVITAVVLGGTSVAGGEGTVLGSVLGMLIISALRNGLTLIRFPTERQAIIVGLLLIAAVGADRLLRRR